MTSSMFTQSSELMNVRKETYPEMKTMDQQSAYSYFNQASAMQLFHQSLMSSWPFYPTFFPRWPLAAPSLPYASPTSNFTGLNEMSEAINNSYLSPENNRVHDENSSGKDEATQLSYSSHSGSISPVLPFGDFTNRPRVVEKKDSKKSFECQVCNKTFGYKHVLQNHEKTHTGEKNYRCTKCNKCFRRDHHLKVHMRLHSGEKPYACTWPSCDRQFVQVANLRRHLKTHESSSRLAVHENSTTCKQNISHPPFQSESSLDSVDMMKSHNKLNCTSYKETLSSVEVAYGVPEQSEPEDLSVKSR